nr:hypothetical protein [Desulfatitalea tepidiphila]
MLHGKARVNSLIEAFAAGSPPFIFSSALPAGGLPFPVLPGIARGRFKAQFADTGSLFEQLRALKSFRKQTHWHLEQWQCLEGRISQERLFTEWLVAKAGRKAQKQPAKFNPDATTVYQPHVSIDRLSGSVLQEGGLFFSSGTWYRPGLALDLYVETADLDTFETLFRHVETVGFGADRTTGKGQFKFERDNTFDPAPFLAEGTHRLSLSVCAAMDMRSFEGYWIPFVKHGRAWNGFGESNPYKKPFMAFAEGSLFKRMPKSGYLLRNIHSDPGIVQVCWPLTIPVTLEENHAD